MKKVVWIIVAVVGFVILACIGIVVLVIGGAAVSDSDGPTIVATSAPAVIENATGVPEPAPTDSPSARAQPTAAPKPQPTSEPTAEPTAEPASAAGVGDTVEDHGVQMTINELVMGWESTGQFSSDPDEGNQYVAFDVTIANVGDDESPYNPFYFELKDSEGFEYNQAFVLSGPEPSFGSGDLDPGDRARGWMIFEVPIDVEGLKAIYEPLTFGDGPKITILLQP